MPRRRNRASTGDSAGSDVGSGSAAMAGGRGDGTAHGGTQTQLSEEEKAQKKTELNKKRKRRKKENKQEKCKLALDIEMDELLYTMRDENGNLVRKKLMQHLEKEALDMYPDIGRRTLRVPHVYVNAGKESDDFVSDYKPPQANDHRSDRAESFFADCVYHLSEKFCLNSVVGPLFIITSYEYQHYLSRLKDHYQNKQEENNGLEPELLRIGETAPGDEAVSSATSSDDTALPTTTLPQQKREGKKGRGEIDMLILCRNHVIFCEVKAVGDNFEEHGNTDKSVVDKLWAIKRQLGDDLRVFAHVMRNVLSETDADSNCGETKGLLKKSLVAVLPNLENSCIQKSFQMDSDLAQAYREMGIKILTKEQMPFDRNNILKDMDRFAKWWIENIFSYALQADGTLLLERFAHHSLGDAGDSEKDKDTSEISTCTEDDGMTIMKRIVGRYLGLLSVVQVSKTNKLSPYHVEARSEGQMIWYIGKRFSDIVLTPDQRKHVEQHHQLGYLHGPPGSGKTVVLAVRARKWILHDNNFVVIINMYRGCTKGRVIGRHMYNTVTVNFNDNVQDNFMNHCLQFPADVDTFCDKDFQCLKRTIQEQFGNDLGTNGSRLLFIVDETYVQDYWNSVYKPLRENFTDSAMWCAGLFGKEPDGFTSFALKKVMRCPSSIQGVLWLIDWVEERKACYSKSSVDAGLPTDGAQVITVRHHSLHGESSTLHPSQCRECGKELASLLEQLDVEKPGSPHQRPDLKEWSLRCSDVLILVGMPRWLFSFHKITNESKHPGYLDTTIRRYQTYMKCYENCPLLQELIEHGYPVKVHTELSCPGLLPPKSQTGRSARSKSFAAGTESKSQQQASPPGPQQVINVTWVYTYQGMENKVIIFVPGDHAKPQGDNIPDLWTNPESNIPCPGLLNDLKETETEIDSLELSKAIVREQENSSGASPVTTVSSTNTNNFGLEETESDSSSEGDTDSECGEFQSKLIRDSDKHFKKEDIDVYGRWDKNNLLIAGSRSTSLLVTVTCGTKPLRIESLRELEQQSIHDEYFNR